MPHFSTGLEQPVSCLRIKYYNGPSLQRPKIMQLGRTGNQGTLHYFKSRDVNLGGVRAIESTPSLKPARPQKVTCKILDLMKIYSTHTQDLPESFTPPKSPSSVGSESENNSENTSTETVESTNFKPQFTSSVNDILMDEETNKSINIVHQHQGTLKLEDVLTDHECKKEETGSLENVEIVNYLFQSGLFETWDKKQEELKSAINQQRRNKKLLTEDSRVISGSFGKINSEYASTESFEIQEMDVIATSPVPISTATISAPSSIDLTSGHLAIFMALKKARDIECLQMSQASKALYHIKKNRTNNFWLERLMAERVLLETSEKMRLLQQLMRDATYSIPELPLLTGTITVTNISMAFVNYRMKTYRIEPDYTMFFMLTVSHDSRILFSEYLTGERRLLEFKQKFSFANVASNYEVKLKLFCLKLRTSNKYIWNRFRSSGCFPMSGITYENLLIKKYEDKNVFTSSFKLCAEATLMRHELNKPSSKLIVYNKVFDQLNGVVKHEFRCDGVNLNNAIKSGFLDMGNIIGEAFFWDRVWCVLKGTKLRMYRHPSDEDFGKPVGEINMMYCFNSLITEVENCSKPRCFQLQTKRPAKNEEEFQMCFRLERHFCINKFTFSALSSSEYHEWTNEIQKHLQALRGFKLMVFE
ncbi:anillin-like [Euwallacea similis]|uniref:anillin-like n=1 Tax=Euwallacea similis TaxID=1736056 RepID=UPI00344E6CC0